jgi:hypothetical protein
MKSSSAEEIGPPCVAASYKSGVLESVCFVKLISLCDEGLVITPPLVIETARPIPCDMDVTSIAPEKPGIVESPGMPLMVSVIAELAVTIPNQSDKTNQPQRARNEWLEDETMGITVHISTNGRRRAAYSLELKSAVLGHIPAFGHGAL